MKKQLLTLLSIILIITACSKNESDPTNENGVSLGNDSLVNRLKLKPSDKQGLSINSQLFKDSKGAYLVTGEKNKKYWLGYFDRDGNELSTKTFDDPTEMKEPFGAISKLGRTDYDMMIEVSGSIYVVRQLSSTGFYFNIPHVESLIRVNTNSHAITNEYAEVYFEERDGLTSFIGPWFNNAVIITKMKINKPGTATSSMTYIYSADNTLLVTHKGALFYRTNSNYIPLSMTEFLDLRKPRYAARVDISNTTNPIFNTDLFPSLIIETERVTIKKKSIENNILTVEAEVLSYNGDKKSLTSKLDVRTGKLLN